MFLRFTSIPQYLNTSTVQPFNRSTVQPFNDSTIQRFNKRSASTNEAFQQSKQMQDDEQPPFLKSWNQIYAMVLIIHVVLIFLFYLFTEAHA